jgi:hypothetical protein
MSQLKSRARARIVPSPELVHAVGAAVAVLASGAALVAILPEPTLWQEAAAFLAPAGLAFLVHWWNAQQA